MAIKVMVVDDMAIYRKILSEVVSQLDDLEIIGSASNGVIALKKMAITAVDLVFLDVNMPEMDGLETLKEIRKRHPDTLVIMVSSVGTRESKQIVEALENGALEFIEKPSSKDFTQNVATITGEIKKVINIVMMRLISLGKAIESKKPAPPTLPEPPRRKKSSFLLPTKFGVVAIGVSTGGPESLSKMIPKFPANFPLPIVLVQHMPKGFTASLAEALNKLSPLNVVEAKDGEKLERGKLLISPGGTHMIVAEDNGDTIVRFDDGPPENSCKPAVDVLYRSLAEVFGDKGVISVILTGMGQDGMKGVMELKQKQCLSITQSKETCVIYAMPKAVDEADLSDVSIDLEEIPSYIENKLHSAFIR